MKNLKKKFIKIIFKFMNVRDMQYGSREILFRGIIKELIILLICWIVVMFFLIFEKQILMKILLIWVAILLPFEILFIISTYFYLKKEKSDVNRIVKENLFYFCIVIFAMLILPYLILFKIANNLEFQNIFEYSGIFIFEICLSVCLLWSLVYTWKNCDEFICVDQLFIIISLLYFGAYFLLRKIIRWIFIREKYNRCEYILEYSTLMKKLHVIASLALTIISFYYKEIVIVIVIYMILETLLENFRTKNRKFDLVLTLFKETFFVLKKVMPTIKYYDTLIINLKYSVDKTIIESYATVYKEVNNTRQGKNLQMVMDAYNKLLNQKYDCTRQENIALFRNDIINALNVAGKYLLYYL